MQYYMLVTEEDVEGGKRAMKFSSTVRADKRGRVTLKVNWHNDLGGHKNGASWRLPDLYETPLRPKVRKKLEDRAIGLLVEQYNADASEDNKIEAIGRAEKSWIYDGNKYNATLHYNPRAAYKLVFGVELDYIITSIREYS